MYFVVVFDKQPVVSTTRFKDVHCKYFKWHDEITDLIVIHSTKKCFTVIVGEGQIIGPSLAVLMLQGIPWYRLKYFVSWQWGRIEEEIFWIFGIRSWATAIQRAITEVTNSQLQLYSLHSCKKSKTPDTAMIQVMLRPKSLETLTQFLLFIFGKIKAGR